MRNCQGELIFKQVSTEARRDILVAVVAVAFTSTDARARLAHPLLAHGRGGAHAVRAGARAVGQASRSGRAVPLASAVCTVDLAAAVCAVDLASTLCAADHSPTLCAADYPSTLCAAALAAVAAPSTRSATSDNTRWRRAERSGGEEGLGAEEEHEPQAVCISCRIERRTMFFSNNMKEAPLEPLPTVAESAPAEAKPSQPPSTETNNALLYSSQRINLSACERVL